MRSWQPTSLNGRILRNVFVGVLLAAACHAVAAFAFYRVGSDLLVHNGLVGQAEDIAESARFDAGGHVYVWLDSHMQWGYSAHVRHLQYRVIDQEGHVLVSSDGDYQSLHREGGVFEARRDRFNIVRDGEAMQVVTVPATIEGRAVWIQAARSDRFLALAEESILPVVVESTLLAGGLALALFASVVWWSVRRAMRPVREASSTAQAIGPRNTAARIASQGLPSEIAPLVSSVNDALGRLETGYRAQQRFIANAAHELKTPLALLRARIELDGRAPCRAASLREVDGMARIVGQLLHLAEAADPASYRRVPIAWHRLALQARASVAPLADAKRISVDIETVDAPHDAVGHDLVGDAAALVAAVRNLLENAIRHSPSDDRVVVRIEGSRLAVFDRGNGLSDEARAHMFERFWRADRNGDGAGLGLAIVREVVEAHGGQVDARNRDDGPGAEVWIALPRHSPR
ncbi:MAG: HAMP domain-containing histidine kinase [Lysobacter sp.]|nr:HAMP domain-containing histidine kinase [Lysobacter sp.]